VVLVPLLEVQTTRPLADTRGSESGTGAVGRAGVEGSAWQSHVLVNIKSVRYVAGMRTNKGNVVLDILGAEARLVRQTSKGGDSRKDGVGLHMLELRNSTRDVSDRGRLTCVPPSPGRLLYHRPSWGPASGSWLLWSE
jgi:hypothetical protein